jgi:hypothetical protein
VNVKARKKAGNKGEVIEPCFYEQSRDNSVESKIQ